MVRFVHASDLRLGLTHRFFSVDARARYAQARFDVVSAIGRLATDERAAFVVVAGDVFETNHVRPRTVVRALDALADIPVPVYLLPGSHDPLDAASVYRSPTFLRSRPTNVTVLETAEPVTPPGAPGVRIVGAPWLTRHPLTDPSARALDAASTLATGPTTDAPRPTSILVAHGAVDTLGEAPEPSALRQGAIEAAIADGRIAYAALGARAATTRVGDTGRAWYAGTPQPVEFDGGDVGNVLVVTIDGDRCEATRRSVGTWRLRTETIELDTGLGAAALRARLDMVPTKERTVIRPALRGRISLTEHARVQRIIADARTTFASIEEPVPTADLVVRPTDDDFASLGLAGFGSATVARLRDMAAGTGDDADTALAALSMLVRLATADARAAADAAHAGAPA